MSHDVSAPVAKRGQQNAVANARQRLVEVRDSVGTAHPDYASALIQLALLLIMHGDPTEAEPLLREALDIRRVTLGERHPDYATCLSSLAGLLWARGDLDSAEPLLRQALVIRCEILGERHPKSIVSQNSLDQLLQAKKAWDSAASLETADQEAAPQEETPSESGSAPVTQATAESVEVSAVGSPAAEAPVETDGAAVDGVHAATEPVAVPEVEDEPNPAAPTRAHVEPEPAATTGRSRAEFALAIEELAEQFAGLGGELHSAVGHLKDGGILPAETLLEALRDGRSRFASLRGEVLQFALGLGMGNAESKPADSLQDLRELLVELERYELERSRTGQARRQALATLEQVARLVYADPKDFPPLRECQEAARGLRESIEAAHPADLPAEAFALADGNHPYNALLALADAETGLNDDEWANALELVQTELGKPLSVAAARSKIVAGPAT
ncbi:MAG: tetratricopeptide repeat protein [Isosphaeraceae bacterium]|nr:tetratricopeptide repeat protein [Isosphaeraceae bacterium]